MALDINEFLMWRIMFSMDDDGLAAYQALKKVSALEFEFALKSEGWIERAEAILAE